MLILLDVHHANASAELLEAYARQGLGEDVGKLLTNTDVLDIDLRGVDAVVDVVVAHLNVLAPIMKDRILAQPNG
jgi:hypothetical protein